MARVARISGIAFLSFMVWTMVIHPSFSLADEPAVFPRGGPPLTNNISSHEGPGHFPVNIVNILWNSVAAMKQDDRMQSFATITQCANDCYSPATGSEFSNKCLKKFCGCSKDLPKYRMLCQAKRTGSASSLLYRKCESIKKSVAKGIDAIFFTNNGSGIITDVFRCHPAMEIIIMGPNGVRQAASVDKDGIMTIREANGKSSTATTTGYFIMAPYRPF